MYDKGVFTTIEFSTPEGGWRTIRKTELDQNTGFLIFFLYTLSKGHIRNSFKVYTLSILNMMHI